MDMEILAKFVELTAERKSLEAKAKDIKANIDALERQLKEQFIQAGVQSINVDSSTVYLHRQIWARPANGDFRTACRSLRALGLKDFVEPRFNVQALSAYYRDLEQAGEAFPNTHGHIEINEVIGIRARKS